MARRARPQPQSCFSPRENPVALTLDEADARALVALRGFVIGAARRHRQLDHHVIRSGLVALEAVMLALRAEVVAAGSDTGSDRAPSGWITSHAAAARRGITSRAITKAALNGRLPAVKVGGRWWIDPKGLPCEDEEAADRDAGGGRPTDR